MKIILTRTGGFIPIKKRAETEVSWTEEELGELLSKINIDHSNPGASRDSTYYQLSCGNKTALIDLEKVPAKYKTVFETLKDDLLIVKQ